jgi:N-acetylglucosamine kinase-like BadF-type ATPase
MRYLGIDGGGSKTSFLSRRNYYNEICHIHSGPSNYLSVGADAAKKNPRAGSRNSPNNSIVCGGFAGAGRPIASPLPPGPAIASSECPNHH